MIFPAKIFSQNYNVNTVETLNGQIMRVDKFSSGKNSSGIHLLLKTGKDSIAVHVGPEWYLMKQNVQFNVNDNIEVKGSRMMYDNRPAIIAAEIKKGNSTLVLLKDFPFGAEGTNERIMSQFVTCKIRLPEHLKKPEGIEILHF
jgi:hypothetical protein